MRLALLVREQHLEAVAVFVTEGELRPQVVRADGRSARAPARPGTQARKLPFGERAALDGLAQVAPVEVGVGAGWVESSGGSERPKRARLLRSCRVVAFPCPTRWPSMST